MIISGNDTIGISALKAHFMHNFKTKDLGSLTCFLCLKISRNINGIHVHQRKYVEDLITHARVGDAKTFDTLLVLNVK